MNRTVWLTRILVLLVLIQLISYRNVLGLLGAPPLNGGLIALIYLTLTIASMAGLLLRRSWGFYSLYALVVLGTVMLSIKFVPLRLTFLPLTQRWIGLMVLNVAVLIVAALGHYWSRRDAIHVPSSAA